MCWVGKQGESGVINNLTTYQEARYGDFSQYANRSFGPVVVTDISCDYDAHYPFIASTDFDRYAYCNDYAPKYNVTLTCGNPEILKQILELIKNTNFYDCSYVGKKALNANICYIGAVNAKEDLPQDAKVGEMCCAGGDFYVYGGEDWEFIFNESDVTCEKNDVTMIQETTRYKMKHRILFK